LAAALSIVVLYGFFQVAYRGLGVLKRRAEDMPRLEIRLDGPGALAGEWSRPVNGLKAQWRVAEASIPAVGGTAQMLVNLHNTSGKNLGLLRFTLPPVDAVLRDANGESVSPTNELLLAQRTRTGWGTIEPGKDMVVWVSGGPSAPAVAAHVTIGTRRWLLRAGRYTAHGTYTSKYDTTSPAAMERVGATLWQGEIELPPVTLTVLPRTTSAPAVTLPGAPTTRADTTRASVP
jgi:hypothetical protein